MEFAAAALQVLAQLLHSSGELETQLQVHCHGTRIILDMKRSEFNPQMEALAGQSALPPW